MPHSWPRYLCRLSSNPAKDNGLKHAQLAEHVPHEVACRKMQWQERSKSLVAGGLCLTAYKATYYIAGLDAIADHTACFMQPVTQLSQMVQGSTGSWQRTPISYDAEEARVPSSTKS